MGLETKQDLILIFAFLLILFFLSSCLYLFIYFFDNILYFSKSNSLKLHDVIIG